MIWRFHLPAVHFPELCRFHLLTQLQCSEEPYCLKKDIGFVSHPLSLRITSSIMIIRILFIGITSFLNKCTNHWLKKQLYEYLSFR